ncbi:RICIN domain-containing protein [Kitasatospora sp. NPDC056446]|uniref:RICIN domain-containing protein n=1 Tax=Kitasatospora sp. NPDC056446 TaxID=3345819 RepID=UPI0036C77991
MFKNTVVKRRLGSAAGALALAVGGGLLAAAPASALNYYPIDTAGKAVQVQVAFNGKCLEVADWRTDDGAPVRQWSCTGGANQKWTFTNGVAVNQASGKCLAVVDASTVRGAFIEQRGCDGSNNQIWGKVNVGADGYLSIHNVNSSYFLDVSGWNPNDGAAVDQWDPNLGANQRWLLS